MTFITAIVYNITIDADQYSPRVTSRGLFKENNERCLQKTMIVNQAESCSEYVIHIQVRPQSSLSSHFFLKTNEWRKPKMEAYGLDKCLFF